MTISKQLLDILCCPVSHVPLQKISKAQLHYLNTQISAGDVQTVDGQLQSTPLDDALITTDVHVIYPIREQIPVLLYEAGIGTTQFNDFPA